jgi:putative membrane protein
MPESLSTLKSASPTRSRAIHAALATTLALYALSRVIEVLPSSTPSPPIVALEILSALAFALLHGARHYGRRGILVFAVICLLIGNAIENLGVLTGFPFGHYEFLPLMGPKLLHVPILLGVAYIGMAYVSWTLARLILGATSSSLSGPQFITVPLLASFIMTAWDVAQDPVWSTLLHAWLWRDGGLWFGVPVTNFAGWLLTVFLIYCTFALYLVAGKPASPDPGSPHWRAAVLLYALCAFGNVLQLLRRQPIAVIADRSGTLWRTAAILRASALVSIFVMGSFALLAWIRIPRSDSSATD